ncbi:hypothetical protein BAU15_12515 [Enterococcus sp. JM4C]|uniref:hypothetical protein n=1 Tax=Candidatus Enterococcus huntleyi TaxID=1857217 RepID=UPI00137B76F4|nr:hypothetical protein [Enterococcus sp. JM4C]KAF1296096.1 hypothetical protein BAU15_12515 [Enterococcus sp. JM4C]
MKNYSMYLLKTALKTRLNLIPLLLPVIIVLVLFSLNMRSSATAGYVHDKTREAAMRETSLMNLESVLEDEEMPKAEREELMDGHKQTEARLTLLKDLISFAQQGNWQEALAIETDLMEQYDLPTVNDPEYERNTASVSGINLATEQQIVMTAYETYKKLGELNLAPEMSGQEKTGLGYMYRMMDSVYPIIFSICLIALLSSVLCVSMIDRLDIEDSFPQSAMRFHTQKSGFLMLFGFAFYLFFLLVPLVIAGITGGIGSLHYPISKQTVGYTGLLSLSEIILKAGLLQVLAIVFVVLIVYLIADLTRSNLSTLFISIVAIIGLVIATGYFEPLNGILHVLPTTYFHSVSVITESLVSMTGNAQISFQMGIIVLSFSSLLVYGLLMIMKYSREKRQLFFQQ